MLRIFTDSGYKGKLIHWQIRIQVFNMDINHIPAYCINLKTRQDRREFVETEFKQNGFTVKIFEGVDGSGDIERILFDFGVKVTGLSKGEVGCMLSHLSLWNMLVHSAHDYFIIFEDDVCFIDSAFEQLQKVWVSSFSTYIDCPLVFYFGFFDLSTANLKAVSGVNTTLVKGPKPLHSYIISKKAAEILLEKAKSIGNMVPIDNFVFTAFDRIQLFSVSKSLCHQHYNLNSDVQEKMWDQLKYEQYVKHGFSVRK